MRCVDNRDPDRVVGQPGRTHAGRRAPDLEPRGVGPLAGIFEQEGGMTGGSGWEQLRCGWLSQDHAWHQEREDEQNTERERCLDMGSLLAKAVPNLRSGTGLLAAGRAAGSPAAAASAAGSAAGSDGARLTSMSPWRWRRRGRRRGRLAFVRALPSKLCLPSAWWCELA